MLLKIFVKRKTFFFSKKKCYHLGSISRQGDNYSAIILNILFRIHRNLRKSKRVSNI